jgi:hypothetical protein
MWEKSCFQTSRFEISICIWLCWFNIATDMLLIGNVRCCLQEFKFRRMFNRMYFCFSSFGINYDWFILVRYVSEEKYMCLGEDELWQLQDKHYEFWCFRSNNGIFWMVICTFHIDHDMFAFALFDGRNDRCRMVLVVID